MSNCTICERIELYAHCVLFLFCIIPLIIIWLYQCRKQEKIEMDHYIKRISLISIIGFIIAYIAQLLYLILYNDRSFKSLSKNERIIQMIIDGMIRFAWSSGEALTHILFLWRLHKTFYGTKYQSSMTVFKLCYIGIATFIILQIGVIIVRTLWNLFILNNANLYSLLLFILESSMVLLDLMISVILVSLFTKKLFAVNCSLSDINNTTFSTKRIKLTESQSSLISVISKYTILSIIAIGTSSIIQMIQSCVQILWFFEHNEKNITYIMMLSYWYLWPVDIIINIWCIYLNLEHSQKQYDFCCGKLQIYCNLWCKSIAKKKIEKYVDLEYILMEDDNSL